MSVLDVEHAEEKFDYDIIYRSKIESIESELDTLISAVGEHRNELINTIRQISELRNMIHDSISELYIIKDALRSVVDKINESLPDYEKVYFP